MKVCGIWTKTSPNTSLARWKFHTRRGSPEHMGPFPSSSVRGLFPRRGRTAAPLSLLWSACYWGAALDKCGWELGALCSADVWGYLGPDPFALDLKAEVCPGRGKPTRHEATALARTEHSVPKVGVSFREANHCLYPHLQSHDTEILPRGRGRL